MRAESARCEKLEALDLVPPFSRETLRELGITGVEFAAFRTQHPAGLAADRLPVRSVEGSTEPGPIFMIDRECHFVHLDIAEPLPFATGSLDWVYAEHLIEHVAPDVAIDWLAEVHRVLAPGGLLRLSTPDLARYARSYLAARGLPGGERGMFDEHRDRMCEVLAPAPQMPARPAFMMNQIFYLYGHRWIYDVDELRYSLAAAGFDPDAVRECEFGRGTRADVAALDSPVRNDESIYVEVTTVR